MITVRLHGHLAKKFGKLFRFEARSIEEAIRALSANFPSFNRELSIEERAYHLIVNRTENYSKYDKIHFPLGDDSTIDIIPAVEGGGNPLASIGMVILGAALIVFAPYVVGFALTGSAAGGAAAMASIAAGGSFVGAAGAALTALGYIGWGLVAMGIASLLAPDPEKIENGDKLDSSSFSGTENTVGQGSPIPIGYGRLLVGSNVVSLSNESSISVVARSIIATDGTKYDLFGGDTATLGYLSGLGVYGLTLEELQQIATYLVNGGGGKNGYAFVNNL